MPEHIPPVSVLLNCLQQQRRESIFAAPSDQRLAVEAMVVREALEGSQPVPPAQHHGKEADGRFTLFHPTDSDLIGVGKAVVPKPDERKGKERRSPCAVSVEFLPLILYGEKLSKMADGTTGR